MPTRQQLYDRWAFERVFGKEVYADNYNVRGSAYVGRTRGLIDVWCEEEEIKERFNNRFSLHKKHLQDAYRTI